MSKEDRVTVTWTAPMLARFKKAYAEHKAKGDEEFTFDGNEFVLDYAKYLIEYLDGHFATRGGK